MDKKLISIELAMEAKALNVRWQEVVVSIEGFATINNARRCYFNDERAAFLADWAEWQILADIVGLTDQPQESITITE